MEITLHVATDDLELAARVCELFARTAVGLVDEGAEAVITIDRVDADDREESNTD